MRKRLAIISPLDESELSLSALWTRELAPRLCSEFELELFSDDAGVKIGGVQGIQAQHFLRMFERENAAPFDAVLTFVEDSPRNLFTRFALVGSGALCVAIDATLERMFVASPWEFEDPKDVPVVTQTLAPAFAVGVMNAFAAGEVRSLLLAKPVFGTALPIRQASAGEKERAAERDGEKFCIAYSARYFVEDRARAVIDAVLSLIAAGSSIRLDWLCTRSNEKDVCDFLSIAAQRRGLDLSEIVRIVPVRDFESERIALAAADLFLFLRGDLLRSPTSALYHALALGVPSVVLDFGPVSELPESVVVRVPAGAGEDAALRRALTELMTSAPLRSALSKRAIEYIEDVHSPDAVIEDLRSVIRSHATSRKVAVDGSNNAIAIMENRLWA